jgi:CTP:molybdopterin cytidylyltransferase MocA
MGSPKPLLPLAGSTYLQRVLQTLHRAPVSPVLVVLGARADEVRAGTDLGAALVVDNPRWETGMLSSLQAGVVALRRCAPDARAMLACLVDSPRFAQSTATALVTEFLRTAAPIVLPSYHGRHGHPVLMSREVWPALLEADGPPGARAVIDAYRGRLSELAVDDPWILRDADTPADHERMSRGDHSDATRERG